MIPEINLNFDPLPNQVMQDLFIFGPRTGRFTIEDGKERYTPFLEANNLTWDDACCLPSSEKFKKAMKTN